MRGRKPIPRALRTGVARDGAGIAAAQPRCPDHLAAVARKEWRRLAGPLHAMGVLTVADRAALAAYCQSWARWVEAERRLAETPVLLKTPSGYVQQSPWLSVSNKQLEIMGRYMAELGLTPSSRARIGTPGLDDAPPPITEIRRIVIEAAPFPRKEIGDGQTSEDADRPGQAPTAQG